MKTWDDVRSAAMHNVILQHVVMAADTGRATREEALIVGILNLAEMSDKQHDLIVEYVANTPKVPFLMTDPAK